MSIHCENGSTVHLVFSHTNRQCQLLVTVDNVCLYSAFDRTVSDLRDQILNDLENFGDYVGYVDVPRVCEYLERLT